MSHLQKGLQGLSHLLTSWRRMRWAVIHPLELREAQTPLHSSHPLPASRKESSGTATSTRPDVLRLLFKLPPYASLAKVSANTL